MGVKTIGFGLSDQMPTDARLLRLTFGETYSLNPDALFASYWPSVYDKLSPVANVYPIARPGVASGSIAAVVDVGNRKPRTGGELVSALQMLDNNFVELKSVELLSATAQKLATTPTGAQARDAQTMKVTDDANKNSAVSKLLGGLQVTANTVKWIAIVAVVVILLVYAGKLRHDVAGTFS